MRDLVDRLLSLLRERHACERIESIRARLQASQSDLETAEHGLTAAERNAVRDVLMRTYFAAQTPARLADADMQQEVDDHTWRRYWHTMASVCPWITSRVDVADLRAIEIGCGTGSSTAAFARIFREVQAFEISDVSGRAAIGRLEAMRLPNAHVHIVEPATLTTDEDSAFTASVGAVIFFAVLEHMTIAERIAILRRAWRLLSSGGILVVGETPNRLTWFDHHTARLPFFHALPGELALDYVERSGRQPFVRAVQESLQASREAGALTLARWGTGVSYHEFELAIGPDVHDHVIASGYEPETLALAPVTRDEALLSAFLEAENVPVHEAFARHTLYLILQKP